MKQKFLIALLLAFQFLFIGCGDDSSSTSKKTDTQSDPGPSANVVISQKNFSLGENGGTGIYTIKLNSKPSSDVIVSITSSDSSIAKVSNAGSLTPANSVELIFTAANFGTTQTVTVTGVNDDIDNDYGSGGSRATSITHNTSSIDTNYHDLDVSPVLITATDDDDIGSLELIANPASISEKSPNSGSNTLNNTASITVIARFTGSTSGGVDNSSVRIPKNITIPVVLNVGGSNSAQQVDFVTNLPVNFNISIASGQRSGTSTAQSLVVVDDGTKEGTETLLVSSAYKPQGSSNNSFVSPATINITDPLDIILSKANLSVSENGGSDSYTIKLSKAPSHSVSVSLVSGGSSVATVSPSTLTFEPNDNNGKIWSTPQTVTIIGVDDDLDNDYGGGISRTTNITHSTTSTDSHYNNLSSIVQVTATDDDVIGSITLSASPDSVTEQDTSAQTLPANNTESIAVTAHFTGSTSNGAANNSVRLSSDVVLPITVGAGDIHPATVGQDFQSVSGFNITIPAGSDARSRGFNLTTIDDSAEEGNERIKITSSHAHFPTINSATITLKDNDGIVDGDIVLSEKSIILLGEKYHSSIYNVKLSKKPKGTVTVTVTSSDAGVIGINSRSKKSTTLTFDPSNYYIDKFVTVYAVHEPDQIRDRTATVTHSASGGGYVGVADKAISVIVRDSDPYLRITDAPLITLSNYKNYTVSGVCKNLGENFSINFAKWVKSINCVNGKWTVSFSGDIVVLPNREGTAGTKTFVISPNLQMYNEYTIKKNLRYCINHEPGSSNVHMVCHYEDLKKIGTAGYPTTFAIAFDIDATPSWSEGEQSCNPYDGASIPTSDPCSGWTPLTINRAITVRGNGKTIHNLYMHNSTDLGFFGVANSSLDIEKFHLKDFLISKYDEDGDPQERNVGSFIAKTLHDTKIITSTAQGTIKIQGSAKAGGFIGNVSNINVEKSITIGNSSADVAMTVGENEEGDYGGLVGYVELRKGLGRHSGILKIAGSFTKGSITLLDDITEDAGNYLGLGRVGGLVGAVTKGLFAVNTAYSKMNISRGSYRGGIVGDVNYEVSVSLKNIYFAGAFQDANIPNGFNAEGTYPIARLDRGVRANTDTNNDGTKDCKTKSGPGYLTEQNLFYDTTTTAISYPHPDGSFVDQSNGHGFSCIDSDHPIGPVQQGLTSTGMKVSCSDSTGICALGSSFQFASGEYPKVKKCTNCTGTTMSKGTFVFTPTFGSSLVPGQ